MLACLDTARVLSLPLQPWPGRVPWTVLCMGADHYEDADTSDIKAAIMIAHAANDSKDLPRLIKKLEVLNPTERCATSPLLDGHWETLFTSIPAAWTRGGRLQHIIESWCTAEQLGPGAPGILAGPAGNRWDDVADGRGAYVQRARRRFGSREVRATYTWIGGDTWNVQFVSEARLIFGIPVWRRHVRAPLNTDFDYAIRPTFLDGELCVLRAPAVLVDDIELRGERLYLLRRKRNRLWQDGTFQGLTDRPLFGFELDP